MKLKLNLIAKKAFKNKELVIENLTEKKIKIWYKASHATTLKPFILTKEIEINQKLAEGIGLYCGDGNLNSKSLRHITFTSTDHDIGKFMFNFFTKTFGISFKDITLLIYCFYNQNSEVVKNKWSKIIEVPKNKFKILVQHKKKKDYLEIRINSIIFGKIFRELAYFLFPLILRNSSLRQAFLRGYFAADGSIERRKNKNYFQISHINFAYHKSKETWLRDFIVKCLRAEGIKDIKLKLSKNKQTASIRVCKWKNFILCWKMKLFERCERKKKIFMRIVKKMPIYLKLKRKFREKFFNSLNIKQKDIKQIINCHSDGEISEILSGKHLLLLERIRRLLKFNNLSWRDVIDNSKTMRIGQVGYVDVSPEFLYFALRIKKLI
jgi:hypothetical protein